MNKLLTTDHYRGYPVNNEYNKNSEKKYQLSKDNMREIYLALVHARDNIKRPIALRYTLGLNNDHSFDISKLTRKIKSIFNDTGYSFIYSFEHANKRGLHLEIILVVDKEKYNPHMVYKLLKKILRKIKGISIKSRVNEFNSKYEEYNYVSLTYHHVRGEYLKTGIREGHNLKNEAHFKACIYRSSYLAKLGDKTLVQYKKKFGTTIGGNKND